MRYSLLLLAFFVFTLSANAEEAKEATAPEPLVVKGTFFSENAKPLLDLGVNKLVFALRKVDSDGHWYANFSHHSQSVDNKKYHDGATLSLLDLKTGKVTNLINDPLGGVRDPQLHYSGKKILFSYRKGGQPYYNLYEIDVDGKNLKQLTKDPFDDIEPTYLPDGGIAFCSSRCKRFVQCWFTRVAIVHRCDADGSNIHPLSCNVEQDNTPWVLPDGKLLYQRWEYIDRSQVRFHHLWTMNPDGTNQMVYYGNMHPSTVMIDAKPIPGTHKTVASFCPGHGRKEHEGWVTIVDPSNGPDDRSMAKTVGDKMYRDPYPFREDLYLVANHYSFGLLVGNDAKAQFQPIWELSKKLKQEGLWVHEPRPVQPREKERVIPKRTDLSKNNGIMTLENVYIGRNMGGIQQGDIKKLLILEALPKPVNFSGGWAPTSLGGTFTLTRALGTVPVEEDGSAHFELPPLRSFFFVALDKDDLSVKRMQSFTMVQPGERLSCIGCHEERGSTAPVGRMTTAMRRPPSKIKPIPAGLPDVFDFPRDIQPILDKYCLKCHDVVAHGTNKEGKPNGPFSGGISLTGDDGQVYSHAYANLTLCKQFTDGRNNNGNNPPRSIGTSNSPLMKKISGEHKGVKVTPQEKETIRYWIETGAVYAGTNAALGTGMLRGSPPLPKKCAGCHEGGSELRTRCPGMGGGGQVYGNEKLVKYNQQTLYNYTRPEYSRVLLAPLSKEAGGLGLCEAKSGKAVFADKQDADYVTLLEELKKRKEGAEKSNIRFCRPGFRPNVHYLREMKNYGILPKDHDDTAPVDPYDLDQRYWKSLWYKGKK